MRRLVSWTALLVIFLPYTLCSNFPCGTSFTSCGGRASGVKTNSVFDELTSNAVDIIPLTAFEAQRDETVRQVEGIITKDMLEEVSKFAKEQIDRLFNDTERKLQSKIRVRDFSAADVSLTRYFRGDKYSKDLSYSALVSIVTTEKMKAGGLTSDQVSLALPRMSTAEASGVRDVCPVNLIQDCVAGKYRTYSGHCNNVKKPLWGAVYEPLQRMAQRQYADGISQPRASANNEPLPSARIISELFTPPQVHHAACSLMLAQWASFVYDDMAQLATNQLSNGNDLVPLPCCDSEVTHPECFPISIPNSSRRGSCMSYARTMPVPRENCTFGPREQGNMATSYLDGSHIYGTTTERANKMRSFKDGKLLMNSQNLPSSADDSDSDCKSRGPSCFQAGSNKINFLPTSAALYTIWMRQHNFVAANLKNVNKHWADEKLYQEARRIVIAQIQHITYNEFVPMIVGKENMRRDGLSLQINGYDSGYDMDVDPSTLNAYSSTVGNFFFSLFPSQITTINEQGGAGRYEDLSKLYNDPSLLYGRQRVESLIRFLTQHNIQKPGLHMSNELRENFLRGASPFGLDLAAIIIQMGRDHGIPSYVQWRKSCGLNSPVNWREVGELFLESVNVTKMSFSYDSVDDIDLFVGGLAEIPLKGALVGETFACVLSRQFHNARRGDRFWYENFFYPSAFTTEQLEEIRKTTLARVICDNSEKGMKIQANVFTVPDDFGNCAVSCDSTVIDRLSFDSFIDREPELKLPITKETLEKALRLGHDQYQRLQKAESGRIIANGGPPTATGALLSHALLMAPKRESLDIARTAGILSETTKILIDGNGLDEKERLPAALDVATLQQLLPEVDVPKIIGNFTPFLGRNNQRREECLPQPLPCDHTSKYRTYSGWCNNLKFPKYGNAFGPMRRLLDPAYDDGFDSPRTRSKSKKELPSARTVSNAVHSDAPLFHVKFTHMVMQFGQILDHDMMHSPIARGPNNTILNCSRCDSTEKLSAHCFPIKIDKGDPFFPHKHDDGTPRCMPFARSLLGQLTLGYRNQLNQLTSFLDASVIYGSTDCEANHLRLFRNGLLNFTNLGFNKEALPQGPQERDCRSILRDAKLKCFEAGDERVNEQPGLTVIHTVLLREHNRIATQLHKINNFWTDEQLFQETRRIMIAKWQHIIYAEWLPVVLGCETMAKYDLMPKKTGYNKDYDEHCDASITQEMSTSAFRFGHTLIRGKFPRMNAVFSNDTEAVDLKDHFSNPLSLYNQSVGHMESLLMGLIGAQSMAFDRHITNAVRNHLFAKPGGPLTGIDLPAVNIQRARDHGVQPYNAYREMCGFPRARDFRDLRDTMEEDTIRALKSVYEHVDDIDLFPGLMSERALKGALVGPMLACIIAEQMQRLKKCDRFYYENDLPMTRFTPDQLAEVRKTTLAKILCLNSQWASKIQPNVFLMQDDLTNAPISCEELPDTDLTEWLDRQFCVMDHRVINRGRTKRITPCITCTCTADGPECHTIVVERCESLLEDYLFSEIVEDTSCVIQCASLIRQRRGQL